MRRTFTLLLFTCLFSLVPVFSGFAQTFNCTGLSANRYYLSDTIRVTCDTVFLLNKVTYSFYRNQLKRISITDPKLKELVNTQNDLIKLYEKRIAEMTFEYDTLRKTFTSTLGHSRTFIENSNVELINIDSSLSKAQTNILAAQDSISSVKILLKDEIVKIRKEKWMWGAGGVALGVLLTLVLK